MRRPISLALAGALVALLAGGCAATDPQAGERPQAAPPAAVACDWKRFEAPDGTFSVVLPGDPVGEDDSVRTMLGTQPVRRYKVARGNLQCDVGYLTCPRSPLLSLAGDERILEAASRGTAATLAAQLTSEARLSLAGHSAREFEGRVMHGDETLAAVALLVLSGDRIYHVIVTRPEGDEQARAAAARVLESFRLDRL